MITAMRQLLPIARLATCAAVTLSLLGSSANAETVAFSDATPGKLPPRWTSTQTGKGEAQWTVERDGDNLVLKQSAQAAYQLCIKEDSRLKSGFVQVRFKPLSGKEDQAGGVVWRFKDKNNYYVCRANALENNVVLYKTVSGKRSSLDIVGRTGGYGVKEPVALGEWHTLRVEFKASRFKVIFDGKELFEVEDATFTEPGKLGLWTKADSVTLFDDFSYGNGD